jgi:Tol biopolymer transport system component
MRAFALPCELILSACVGASGSGEGTAPASAQMVFMKGVNGAIVPGSGAFFEIAAMNLNGSGLRQLTSDGQFKLLPHFSPDGRKIAYMTCAVGQYGTADAVTDIAVLDLASGMKTVITRNAHAISATWSPDGSRIAWINAPRRAWTRCGSIARSAHP